ALWLALRAADRPGRLRIAAAIAALVAAYLTHKMAAAIVIAVAVPAALAGAGIVALALGAAFPQRLLSAADAQLLRGLISTTPRWTAPALVFPDGELALGHDALAGIVLALTAAVALVVRRRRARAAATHPRPGTPTSDEPAPGDERDRAPTAAARAAAWPILLLAIAIGLPLLAVTDRQGLGFRLRIAAFVPAALSAAIAIRAVIPRALRRDRVLAAAALALAVLRQPGTQLEGAVVTHPALVTAAQALVGPVPAGATLIIPERHIAFMVAWYTGAPVAIHPDRIPREHRFRLLPLHFIRADSALDRELLAARAEPSIPPPIGFHPRHPNGLVLVAEPTWDWILARLPADERARAAAWPTI